MSVAQRLAWLAAGVVLGSLPFLVYLVVLGAQRTGSGAGVAPDGRFVTIPPGGALPREADCARLVRRSAWEPRPENAPANQTTASGGPYIADVYRPERITGSFTGTTDEILQWGACKWGFDEDIVRAVAAQESGWRMSENGDGGESFGLFQVKRTVHANTFPATRDSTAFNVDYALAYRRACFEGAFAWMAEKNPSYRAGDEWGCVGAWFSGDWYDGQPDVDHSGATWYIARVRQHLANRTWLWKGF